MKQLKLVPLAMLLSLFVVFTSCEKDEETTPVTVESQLIGNWSGSEFYEDGVLSPFNEFFKSGSSIEFKADGTGNSVSLFGTQALTWSYNETNNTLKIEMEALDLGEGLTLDASIIENAEITKIDASNLWYSYDDEGVIIEERYTK